MTGNTGLDPHGMAFVSHSKLYRAGTGLMGPDPLDHNVKHAVGLEQSLDPFHLSNGLAQSKTVGRWLRESWRHCDQHVSSHDLFRAGDILKCHAKAVCRCFRGTW